MAARVQGGWSALLLAAGLLGSLARAQAARSAELERGRTVYTLGTSPRGSPMEAIIFGGERVPAASLPCTQCHRADGSGGVEGGRGVPRLTRATLGMPRESRGGAERARPAYDRAALASAICAGRDSAGRELDALMPRYVLDQRDLDDLLAYLAVLGDEPAPGCDATRARVGTLLPLSGAQAARGQAVRLVLAQLFERWNEAGGIHGRRLELVARDAGASLDEARAAAAYLLDDSGGVLGLLAPAGPAADPQLLGELAARGVPVVGPLGVAPETIDPGSVFWLLPGLGEQGRALARHLGATDERVACIDDGTQAARVVSAALSSALRGREFLTGSPAELAAQRPDRLVCLGAVPWVAEQLAGLSRSERRPRVLLDAVLLAGTPRLDGFAFDLLAPPLGQGWSAGGERFEALIAALAPDLESVRDDLPTLRAAFAAAELLAHALRAAGRELGRERLVSELAGVRRLETGVAPPLSFGRTLRVGTRASLLVSFDARGALNGVRLVEPAPAEAELESAEVVR